MRNPITMVRMLNKVRRLVQDPRRLDEVIALADTVSRPEVMAEIVAHVARDAVGAAALRERPRVRLAPDELRRLPEGTLGRAYVDFMDENGLRAEDLPTRPAHDDATYVRAHLFETHDVWHVVTGFATDEAGELGLQAFYLAQFPARLAPLLLAAGLLNTLFYRFDDRGPRMDAIARGWVAGQRARGLFGQRWNDLWATPLPEVRARLGLPAGGVQAGSEVRAAA
jgi:ubiquinone biosynthesis protein Coq4